MNDPGVKHPSPKSSAAPFIATALACHCPRCGRGKLFTGLLAVAESCPACGLDLRAHDSGDGPAVAVIFLLAPILMGLAFYVEFRFSPPLWVHAVLWPLIGLPLAIILMRPLKAAMVGLQYRHRSTEADL